MKNKDYVLLQLPTQHYLIMRPWISKPQGLLGERKGVIYLRRWAVLYAWVLEVFRCSHSTEISRCHSYTTVGNTSLHSYVSIFIQPPSYYVPLWFQLLTWLFLTGDEQGNPDFKTSLHLSPIQQDPIVATQQGLSFLKTCQPSASFSEFLLWTHFSFPPLARCSHS